MRGGTLLYYFQYYVDQDASSTCCRAWASRRVRPAAASWYILLNTFGLIVDPSRSNVASVGFSLFNMSSQFVTVVGRARARPSWRCGSARRPSRLVGFALTTVFMVLL